MSTNPCLTRHWWNCWLFHYWGEWVSIYRPLASTEYWDKVSQVQRQCAVCGKVQRKLGFSLI